MANGANRRSARRPSKRQLAVEPLESRVVLSANPYADFLQVAEIMYNPLEPTPAETAAGVTDKEQFEFLEFYNSSPSSALDLENVRIMEGSSTERFNFSGSGVTSLDPGGYALVVRDLAAFQTRYGNGLDDIIAGQYSGALSNGGQQIRVLDPAGADVHNFVYDDQVPWPVTPDGYGFSLNLLDPDGNPDHAAAESWTGDSPVNGTPGAANATSQAPIVINELLAHTDPPQVDSIELYNPTSSPVAVGGWFLSDDITNPLLYTIPAGRVVPANGYLVLLGDDDGDNLTNPGPDYFGSKFLLSSVGEDLYLSAGDGVNLLGYSERVSFNGSLNAQTLGRFPNGTGTFFFAMVANTLGAANSEPRLGDVVLSEVMYHPPDPGAGSDPDLLEYVEIQNKSDAPIDLSDWEISGIKYVFSAGQSIDPGAYLVVVPFDPVADAVAIADFNSAYGVDIAANPQQYVGPSLGKLLNSGERLTLFSVDDPPLGTTVKPLIFEDGVDYDDSPPWPGSADGSGNSLHRTFPTAFGDFATSWTAAYPTPGRSTGADGDMDIDGDVDFDDITPFVVGISNPAAYQSQYGVPPAVHGDVDADGDIDFDDIPGFVSALARPVLVGVSAAAAPPAPAPNAVNDSGSRIRENSGSTANGPNSHEFGYDQNSVSSSQKNRSRRWAAGVVEPSPATTADGPSLAPAVADQIPAPASGENRRARPAAPRNSRGAPRHPMPPKARRVVTRPFHVVRWVSSDAQRDVVWADEQAWFID